MTDNQLAKELHELKRRRETPLPLIEMFDALLSLAPGLSAKQKRKRFLEWLRHWNGWNARTPDRNRGLASPRSSILRRTRPMTPQATQLAPNGMASAEDSGTSGRQHRDQLTDALLLTVVVLPLARRAALSGRLLAHLHEVAPGRGGVAILNGAKEIPAANVLACLRKVTDAAPLDAR
jgi:hypothetical protein